MESRKEKVVHISKEMRKSKDDPAAEQEVEALESEQTEDDPQAGDNEEAAVQAEGQEQDAAAKPVKPNRDLSKAAIFMSVLTVLLLVVFFYALNRNFTGLVGEIEDLKALRAEVSEMDGSLGTIQDDVSGIHGDISAIQEKMTLLDAVPDITRRTMLRSMLQDLSQRVAFIAQETDTPEQSAKVKAAQELLKQVEAEMAAQ